MEESIPMKAKASFLIAAWLVAGLMLCQRPAELKAEPIFVTIGSGDVSGVYFPAGLIIAQMINAKRDIYGIRATVESTSGSVFNLNAVLAGHLEFGFAQSDKLYQAVSGLAEWSVGGAQTDLRAVFGIHTESVTLAAADAMISTAAGLKSKRVSLGNVGSGQVQNADDALKAMGLNPAKDIRPVRATCAQALELFQDDVIDAFICTVGHPSGIFERAFAGTRKVRFIPITGPGIDKLVAERPYYAKTTIRVAENYPGLEAAADVETFGVTAILCTSARVPDKVVYAVVKEVFDHFAHFKMQHRAFAALRKEQMHKGLCAPLHHGAESYFKEAGLTK
jgi:hypothetical protein